MAATHWAVRSRWLRASAWWPRFVRNLSAPLVRPLERRVIRWGGNPQDAPLWLGVVVLLLGLAFVLGVRWILDAAISLQSMRGADATAWLRLGISLATWILMMAILVRVIGSWVGVGRYNRWMRPFYTLTDWLVEPIRRRLPPFGMIDLSPVLAYVAVLLLRAVLFSALS